MAVHVMLDLETMDSKPTAALTAIGAVEFDINTGAVLSDFYVKVNLQSSMDAGLTVSGSTINWWLVQNEQARTEMAKEGTPIRDALAQFAAWINPDAEVWGNGAAFDNAILANAYAKTGIAQPWKFWNDRCYRTIKSMHPDVKLERLGTYHNALDDARSQAVHLATILGG